MLAPCYWARIPAASRLWEQQARPALEAASCLSDDWPWQQHLLFLCLSSRGGGCQRGAPAAAPRRWPPCMLNTPLMPHPNTSSPPARKTKTLALHLFRLLATQLPSLPPMTEGHLPPCLPGAATASAPALRLLAASLDCDVPVMRHSNPFPHFDAPLPEAWLGRPGLPRR